MVEHERLQATIHLMSCFLAYPVKSRNHSLAVARINEHVSCPPAHCKEFKMYPNPRVGQRVRRIPAQYLYNHFRGPGEPTLT